MAANKKGKILVAFDFDSTLVEANCDHYILNVVSEHKHGSKGLYPPRTMWDMPHVYRTLHEKGIQPNEVLKCLDTIEFVDGMQDVLLELAKRGHEVIVISDCNSVFIGHTLKKSGLQDCVDDIFTNPAWFDDKGRLRLSEYHHQDWCEICPPNLCKGSVLRNYMRKRYSEGDEYLFVAYIGDGHNDLCPALALSEQDVVFPRIGYDLYRMIQTENCKRKPKFNIKAKVIPWESGSHVKRALVEEIRDHKANM